MFNEYGTDIPEHLSFRTNNSDTLKINESELAQEDFLTLNISYKLDKFKTQTVYRPCCFLCFWYVLLPTMLTLR